MLPIDKRSTFLRTCSLWLSSSLQGEEIRHVDDDNRIDWLRIIPFILLHIIALAGAVLSSWAVEMLVLALLSYGIRMFAITAFYHRYFSHRTFKTSRAMQFVFAFIGGTASQRGALWWAAHHRSHHRYSDTERDPHTPKHGLLRSHMGWFLCRRYYATNYEDIKDFSKFPELVFLNKHELLPPVLMILLLALGSTISGAYSDGSDVWQWVLWGYFIPTVFLIHITLCINSLGHRWGSRRYATKDDSRNNLLLALLTFGEGWHNNHHHFPGSTRQGFYWWELDVTYYVLKLLEKLGLVWDLKTVPVSIKDARRVAV